MRITAIRGKGLASLFDPFEVLLDEGPLAQSGLYCISGQTGAGKSTILDAMCLALFAETPRLRGRSKSKIGRLAQGEDDLRLSDRDPRALLSRGCGEGFAEVEFIGVDQEKYRARWSVRRSRRSSSGRLQKASVELVRVADEKVLSEHPSTKTLAEISNKLGLSFDQFCRSVLLAQGDFSAFLRADDKERADLLERMTGTEVYRKLSKACHLRNRDEQAQAQSAKDAVAALEVWDEETLAFKEKELSQAREGLAKVQAKVTKERSLKEAIERREKLEKRLEEAKLAHEQATLAWKQASEERERLAQLMAVHELLPLHEQQRALQHKSTVLRGSLETSSKAFEKAKALADQAKQGLSEAQARLESRQAEHQSKMPQIRAAQALDLQMTRLDQVYAQQEQKFQGQAQLLKKVQARAAKGREQIEVLDTKLSEIASAWPAYKASEELYARREELCDVLDDLVALQQQHQDKQRSIATLAQTKKEIEKKQLADRERRQEIEQELKNCQTALVGQEEQDSDRLQKLGQASVQCQRAVGFARQLHSTREAQLARLERQAEIHSQQKKLEAGVEKNNVELDEAQKKSREIEIRRDEAKLLRDQAHAQEVMQSHRDLLHEGSPCPLCGATEHPLLQEDQASISDAFKIASQRLQDLEQAQKAQQKNLRELESFGVAQRTRLEASMQEFKDNETQIKSLGARVDETRTAFQAEIADGFFGLDLPLTKELERLRATSFTQDVQGALARVVEVEALSKKLEQACKTLNQTMAQAVKLRKKQEELRQGQEELLKAERALMPKLAKHGEALATLSSEEQALLERSKALRSRLRAMWNNTPGPWSAWKGTLSELHEAVLGWLTDLGQAMHKRSGYEARLEELRAELQKVGQEAELERARLEDARAQFQACGKQREQARTERAAQLGGVSTEFFLKSYQQETDELKVAIQAAQNKNEMQSKAATQELARSESLKEQLAALAGELEQIGLRFEGELEALGLPMQKAKDALEVPKAEVEAMQKAQRALELALNESQALAKGRSDDLLQDRKEHEISLTRGEIQKALDSANEHLEQTQKELVEIEHAFKQNAAKIQQRSSLAKAHEAQLKTANQWAQLNALIGHSEGLSFQRFAQGLSLDRLLLLANQHLQDIDRRYRLSRVHGDSLDLQVVDTMMGDEIRSIHSLSGGESFLISLALALGLSSLSAMHTKVESLFIDEGFGTLDRESLEQVLAALDALQASGRQVGLISHVEGMAEQLGARVDVRPLGHGKSKITVQGAAR